jgi:hypothetical protein
VNSVYPNAALYPVLDRFAEVFCPVRAKEKIVRIEAATRSLDRVYEFEHTANRGGTMTIPQVVSPTDYLPAAVRLSDAEHHMYEAELALHAAHQSHVDSWIAAASDRLHEAILEHSAARRELNWLTERLRPAC